MKPTLNEKFLAYLALFSGLFLSLVAEYYSILGLTSIFSAAVIPVVIMGIALGLGKISATLWLKQNWNIAPWTMRVYLFTAIVVLMIVTSMGIFGFLSKAHSDQNLVSGDAQAKIAIYDEKIKTEKENIEANRKALKQMDEAVDQVMGRSSSETGADKAVAIRRSQQKERGRIQQDIAQSQQTIASLNEQRAPIAAEVRKVEAEVGPIKYIAAFVYGDTDQTILEKAVTWVIVILIVVFDPMAVILLLSSQISFQNFRERELPVYREWTEDDFDGLADNAWVADVGEKPTEAEKKSINDFVPQPTEYIPDEEGDSPKGSIDIVEEQPTVTEYIHCHKCDTELVNAPGIGLFCPNKNCDVKDGPFDDDEPAPHHPDTHPYLRQGFKYPEGWKFEPPVVYTSQETLINTSTQVIIDGGSFGLPETASEVTSNDYIQNEEQKESSVWSSIKQQQQISEEEYIKKSLQNNERKTNTNNTA